MEHSTYQQLVPGETGALSTTGGLADLLLAQASLSGRGEAIVFGEQRYTYAQLEQRASAIAEQITGLGITRGDKAALLLPNGPDFVACFFAAAGLGLTVVPVNPLLKSEEIAHILSDSQSRCLIVGQQAFGQAAAALTNCPAVTHVLVNGQATIDHLQAGKAAVLHLTANTQPRLKWVWRNNTVIAGDPAVIVYTSGTTGKPKGAVLTHANLSFTSNLAAASFNIKADDRFLAVLPLCHIYGLTVVMLSVVSRGGTLVILEKFQDKQALAAVEQEKVTVLPAVPAMYQFMLMEMENKSYNLANLRICVSGAASLPVEIFSRIEEKFGAPLVEGYGLTEVACLASFNRLDAVRKTGSVGLPFEGVAVKIVDQDGRELPPGSRHVGEIAVKGPNVMAGYYRQPQATAEAIKDGWFFTGDLAYKDDEGYIFIVGRKKELIIRGGQNIYPREVEDVICRLNGVLEAAVVGVPDVYMGERVKAAVVRRPGACLSHEDVLSHCKKHLAEYKIPRLVEFVEALPRNSTGKVLKREIAGHG